MKTAQMTSMIFVILIGATMFGLVFRGFGGDDLVHRALSDLPGGTDGRDRSRSWLRCSCSAS